MGEVKENYRWAKLVRGELVEYTCTEPHPHGVSNEVPCGRRFFMDADGVDTPYLSCPWCESRAIRWDRRG